MPQDSMPGDLGADTAVTPLSAAPGWYTAELPSRWSFQTPSGGVLMTTALRAMRAELAAPDLRLRSATTLFCSPVPAGPLEIRVEVLRRGNVAAQVRAALSSTALPGPGLEVSATFARDKRGPRCRDVEPPAVPAPEAGPDLNADEPGNFFRRLPFFANFDVRLARGRVWWHGAFEPGEARFARWFRYRVPPLHGGRLDPLAIPPVADTMPGALIEKVASAERQFFAPSLDLTVHFLQDCPPGWLLVSSWARHADAGYATAEAEIWTEDGALVAYATQTMMIRAIRR